jgi:hypothetical protein
MQSSSSRRGHALLVAGLVATNGCSAIFVRPPRSPQADEAPTCTESRAAPIADTAVGVAALNFGAFALGQALTCSPNCTENLGPALAIISGVVLLGTATSAIYGFQDTGRCREAMSAWCSAHDCGSEPPNPGSGASLRP